MRVAMIGTAYVGLVGDCFADFGHVVPRMDKDRQGWGA